MLDLVEAQHPFHFGHRELIHRIVTEGLAKRVVGADVIALLGERPSLLHERLRRIENRAAIMQLEIDIARISRQRERELLRSLLPLLRLFVLHAAIEMVFTLLRERRDRQRQQATDNCQGQNRMPTVS